MENSGANASVTPLQRDRDENGQTPLGYRAPPTSIEAEQALLGAILVNNRAFEQVSEFLRPEHFAVPVHARIFDAIGKQIGRGQEAKPPTLQFYFKQIGRASWRERVCQYVSFSVVAGSL